MLEYMKHIYRLLILLSSGVKLFNPCDTSCNFNTFHSPDLTPVERDLKNAASMPNMIEIERLLVHSFSSVIATW